MSVTVEFFGVVRQRAATAQCDVEAETLGAALRTVVATYPALAGTCVDGDRLGRGYVANLNGQRFVSDPATPLSSGDAILLLAADAGG